MRIEYHTYLNGQDAVVEVLDADGEQVDCFGTMEKAIALCLLSSPDCSAPEVKVCVWESYAEHNEHC